MAGDWIKLEHGILDKPEVMELSELLDVSPYQVVGHLVEFWFWCDRNLSPECPRVKGTKRGLDRVAGRDGFGDALIQVGWLTFEGGYFSVPNYDTHLSKSAKQRAKEQRKKAFQRSSVSRSCPDSVPHDQGTKAGPEKRREEKSIREREEAENLVINLSNAMQAAWTKWKLHSMDKGKTVNEISEQSQLMKLTQAYPDEADRVAAIEHAIEKNWANVNLSGDHKRIDTPRHAAGKRDSESKKLFDSIFNSKEGAK